ncbi:WG repeat-containing protein [Maribacter sp. X9]|uniref:WG repeat-containing protein n=1 Tax=Maribacter sp. X9 TaxID=3402159 RepID=UPI003AF37A86
MMSGIKERGNTDLKEKRTYSFLLFWLCLTLHVYAQRVSPSLAQINHKGTKCIWIDKKGNEISNTVYDCNNSECNEGICIVVKDNKYGAIDYNGNQVIPLVFDFLEKPLEGLIAAKKNNGNGESRWGYIDFNGKTRIPFDFEHTSGFLEDLGRVTQRVNGQLKTGFINKEGGFIIPPKYEIASIFQEGLAIVRTNFYSGSGYIDKQGNPITKEQYCKTELFNNGIAKVSLNCKSEVIGNPDGHAIYSSLNGFIDKTGKEIIPVIYDQATHWESEGIVLVANEIGEGAYGEKGNYIIPIKAGQEVRPDKKIGLIKVIKKGLNQDNVTGYVNNRGKTIIPFLFEEANFENEFLIGLKKQWHISEPKAKISEFARMGVLDRNGQTVIPFIYEKVWYLDLGYFLVRKNEGNGKSADALFSSSGKIVIPFDYYHISSVSKEGYVLVKKNKDSKYLVIDTNLRTISELEYDEIIAKLGDGLIPVKRDGKWGYVNEKNELIIPCQFDSAGVFENNRAIVSKKKKYGAIDTKGAIIIPLNYKWAPYSYLLERYERQERIEKWKNK